MTIPRDEIARLTEEYGGHAGITHTRRLLHLIPRIAEDRAYDSDVIWLAAHLHDWGGYPAWAQTGVDHAQRSEQIAEGFLAERECPDDLLRRVLECIRLHHSDGWERSLESILLSDADALDFLGVVGVLRDFSRNPRDMRRAYEASKAHRNRLPAVICLPKSAEIAAERVRQMDELLAAFARDSAEFF